MTRTKAPKGLVKRWKNLLTMDLPQTHQSRIISVSLFDFGLWKFPEDVISVTTPVPMTHWQFHNIQTFTRDHCSLHGTFYWCERVRLIEVFNKLDEIGNNANIGIRSFTWWKKSSGKMLPLVGIEPRPLIAFTSNTLLSTLTWDLLARLRL